MTLLHPPRTGAAHWVFAHPRHDSFNGRLFQAGLSALAESHVVATSDLYAQKFDPLFGEQDLGASAGVAGNLAVLAAEAYGSGETAPDVAGEQAKLAEAELLVLQFPLWWYGPPAILKGWLDRVFTSGFTDAGMDPDLGAPRRYGDEGLAGRRALVIVTAGEDARSIGPRGISGDLDSLLFPLTHGALWYVGIETLDLHVVYDADTLTAAGMDDEVVRLEERIRGIRNEPVRRFRTLRDGSYRDTRALHADLHPGRCDRGIHYEA